MIDENINMAIIFEDDCIFNSNFEDKLQNILLELPVQFNILWLGGKTCVNYSSDLNKQISENISIFNEKYPFGTFTYLLSLECAKYLYYYAHNIFKGKLGVDYFMFEFLKLNNHLQYTATNHITWSRLGASEINNIFTTDIQIE